MKNHPHDYPFWTNWNRNLVFRPEQFLRPDSIEDVAEIITRARLERRIVRPVGSGYSYTPLVQNDHIMMSLGAFSGVSHVDIGSGTAVVGAGTRLGILVDELARRGAAIANLGDIDRQTLAGAISTGTHGTGIGIASLSSQILGMTLVDGSGRVQEMSGTDPRLNAARIGLGALGVMTSVTLKVEPLHVLAVERGGDDFQNVIKDLDTTVRSNRNFEFFWFPSHGFTYTKKMNVVPGRVRGPGPLARLGRFARDVLVENALVWIACESCRRWPGGRRAWLDLGRKLLPREMATVPAHRAYTTLRLVRHYEVEYAVPYEHAVELLGLLDEMLEKHPVKTIFPIEVRFTAAEDIPLSMSYGRNVMYVAVHAYRREDYGELFDLCEDLFLRFDGRPHWGKIHSLQAAELRRRYPLWDQFQTVRRELDPGGVFMNGYLRRVFGLTPTSAESEQSYSNISRIWRSTSGSERVI